MSFGDQFGDVIDSSVCVRILDEYSGNVVTTVVHRPDIAGHHSQTLRFRSGSYDAQRLRMDPVTHVDDVPFRLSVNIFESYITYKYIMFIL